MDTSALVAVMFKEPGSGLLHRSLSTLDHLYASNLLEAEIRSAASREGLDPSVVDLALSNIHWVLPDRPLSTELKAVAETGVRLRGADLWHVACALYLAGDTRELHFMTLDQAQAETVKKLGFKVMGIQT